MPNKKSFENTLKELETIVELLEKGNETLDASLNLFTKGVKLASYCKEKLNTAKCQVKELTESEGTNND